MPRYRPATAHLLDDAALPLDSLAVVIPRQSKKGGAKTNVHSQELADHELLALATSHGFPAHRVRIDKRDMGISANTTTIADRPALCEWLRELLPSGLSRVVIFSQEDRAFRDEEEIELNTFIREVKRYRGWVICGHKVYRLWEEYDADMFRVMCKYAAKYIAHHVLGRLHPAVDRAAQRGFYDGRGINVGYIVDYDARSSTYKRYVPYPPHAALVANEIFERFARMAYPSVPALVRAWNAPDSATPVMDPTTDTLRQAPTLYFPAFPPDVDPRILNKVSWGRRREFPPYGMDDPLRRGWLLHEQAARRILSNVVYLGWVARNGQIIRGERLEGGQVRVDPTYPPLELHEPVIRDPDLFWYCFNRVSPYTIEGLPNPKVAYYTRGPRRQQNDEAAPRVFNPRATRLRNAESATLLLLGKVVCGVHQLAFMRHRKTPQSPDYYVCKHYDDEVGHRQRYCVYLPGEEVDRAAVREFLQRLELTSSDVEGIARAWQQQERRRVQGAQRPADDVRLRELEGELENLVASIMHTQVDSVRERLVLEMERLSAEQEMVRQRVRERAELASTEENQALSGAAMRAARSSAKGLAQLRTKWDKASFASRQALMQWVVESITLTQAEDRVSLVGDIAWRGGAITPLQLTRAHVGRRGWAARELEVLRRWYASARWEDLESLLPWRSRDAIVMQARRMRLGTRPRFPGLWHPIPASEMQAIAPNERAQTSEVGLVPCHDAHLGGDVLLSIARLVIT